VLPDAGSGSDNDLVGALVARIDDIDAQLRATAAAVDEKSLKEFRRTVEALSKRDEKFEERVTNKVDVVADRLETLARTVSTTSAALAAKDGEIAQLRRDLDAGIARFQTALADTRRGHDPAELTEMKRTLAELSKQKLPRGLEGRIEELGAKLTMLAQRIDTVSSTVSATAAGLAGRDGDVIALRRAYEADSDRIGAELVEIRRAIDPTPVTELRQAVVELRERTSDQRRTFQHLFGEANMKADSLATRVDTLAASVTSTSARVSGTEEQLSALRAHIEEGGVHLNALAAAVASASERLDARDVELETLERRFHEASTRVDTLADSVSARVSGAEEHLSALRAHVEEGGVHLNSLAAAVASMSERLDARDVELETLERRFHDASTRVDGLVGELSRALAEFPDPASTKQVLESRLNELDRVRANDRVRVEELADRLESSVATLTGRAPEIEELDRRLDDLVTRIDAVDDDRAGASSEMARLSAILEVERAGVRSRLESLAAAQASRTGTVSTDELEESVAGFVGRVEAIEHEREALAARVSRLASAFDTERASFQTQLEALAAALSWASPRSSADERLEELDQRMRDLERDSTAVASRVSQATTLLPTALRSLEARLDEIAPASRETPVSQDLSPAYAAPRAPAPLAENVEHEANERKTTEPLTSGVVPSRGTDP
jgi:chromosome segregation ATPase